MADVENLDAAAQVAVQAQEAVIAAAVSEQTENANQTVVDVLESAEEQIERAEENAQAIAEAAIQTEIGNRVNTLSQEVSQCLEENRQTQLSLQEVLTALTEMRQQLQSLLTPVTVQTIETQPEQSLLSPPALPDLTHSVTEIIPENLPQNVEAASPVLPIAAAPKKRFRLM